jgi:hypothetical protein
MFAASIGIRGTSSSRSRQPFTPLAGAARLLIADRREANILMITALRP